MIVFTGDTLVQVCIHVPGNATAGQCGTLSNAFVKESTAGIENSTIQTVEVNLLDQLSFVPESNLFGISGFFLSSL